MTDIRHKTRNLFGRGSLHQTGVCFTVHRDKFDSPRPKALSKPKFAPAALPGAIFSKPHMRADWFAEWGIAAGCYPSRLDKQPD